MSEPTRSQTQLGLADLKKRFKAVGLLINNEQRNTGRRSTYFALGTGERQTDITISDTFLEDLVNTTEYQAKVDSYARTVALRMNCGSPEVFYCRSGTCIRVSILWPIQPFVSHSGLAGSVILMNLTNLGDGQIARCSMELGFSFGGTIFDILPQTINSVRIAVDAGSIRFFKSDVPQETYQRIKREQEQVETRSQREIERFLAGKAYTLGFLTVDQPSDIWTADPWDAQYLGVTAKELLLAMRIMRANGLLDQGDGPEYARPTDKLLARETADNSAAEIFQSSQKAQSRHSLPNKEMMLSDLKPVIEKHSVSAILVLDLDNFKSVNDTKGHSEGDACLDRVVSTLATVVGRKGKVYRWGSGDEFAVLLPDFSTEEAQVTAERIRASVEQAKPGGEINVTTSVGICGTDRTDSESADEILNFADKAMYESKRLGKNRVTAWPFTATET